MERVLVELSPNRDKLGSVTLFNAGGRKVCGPFAVAARASDALAAAKGNASRNPLLRYGDTPTGVYVVRRFLKSGKGTRFPASQFGVHGVVVIEGISGDAACAEANGRFHLLIGGGPPAKDRRLRSTAGWMRLSDSNLRTLIAALQDKRDIRLEIVERDDLPNRGTVADDPSCRDMDPLALPPTESESRRRATSRDALRGTAASVMVFGFTVSFVVAQGSDHAHASIASVSRGASEAQESGKLLPPNAIAPARTYTKLAYGPQNHPNSALDQLNNATSGHQTTGQTFDNGPGPSDAIPNRSVTTPSATPSPGGATYAQPQTQPGTATPGGPNAAAWQKYLEQQKNQPGQNDPAWQKYLQQLQQQGQPPPAAPPPKHVTPPPPPPNT